MWSALNFRSKATWAMKLLLFFSLSLHETVLLHFSLFSFKTELWFPFTAQTFKDKTKVTWHRRREAQGQHQDCPCINPWHEIGQYRSSSDWSANQNKGRGGVLIPSYPGIHCPWLLDLLLNPIQCIAIPAVQQSRTEPATCSQSSLKRWVERLCLC